MKVDVNVYVNIQQNNKKSSGSAVCVSSFCSLSFFGHLFVGMTDARVRATREPVRSCSCSCVTSTNAACVIGWRAMSSSPKQVPFDMNIHDWDQATTTLWDQNIFKQGNLTCECWVLVCVRYGMLIGSSSAARSASGLMFGRNFATKHPS